MEIVPNKRTVALAKCPSGLFLSKDQTCLVMMTEYHTEGLSGRQRDAYVVASGEYYWGGVTNAADRDRLRVYPCKVKD